MKQLLLLSIRFYQKHMPVTKGLLPVVFMTGDACRFSPTCSEYTYQAIETYGILHGLFLSGKRILRCHPFNNGGYDPIPTKGIGFRE